MIASSSRTSPERSAVNRLRGDALGPAPLVSVIVPTLDGDRGGNLALLLGDISRQSLTDLEVLLVRGVRPNGRARNVGAAAARGRYLVFADDDVRLGHERVLETLIGSLEDDPTLGLVAPSQLVPPDASRFQRMAARQLPRMSFPIVDRLTDTDMVTHMCLAICSDVWHAIGGEHDDLVRGTDPDLRNRVRQAGLRVVVAPDTYAYHPPPASFRTLASAAWRGGRGAAWVRRHHPDLAYDVPDGPFLGVQPVRGVPYRITRFAVRVAGSLVRGRLLLLASDLAYVVGYLSLRRAAREPTVEELA